MQTHLDMRRINTIKEILLKLKLGDSEQTIQDAFDEHVQPLNKTDILLMLQELKNSTANDFNMNDIRKFFDVYLDLYDHSLQAIHVPKEEHPSHPIQVFKRENQAFSSILDRVNILVKTIDNDPGHPTDQLMNEMIHLGKIYSHYNRKEKLFFPIMERYRIYSISRIMWAADDRIRTLFKGTKRMMEKMPDIDFHYVKQAYYDLENACKEMILEEEYLLLPIIQSIFKEADWLAIVKESKAFGYAVDEPEETWSPDDALGNNITEKQSDTPNEEHLRFGGGYLTIKEANHILNNLPLELTFVDKNGIFKYFNEIVESSQMMFIRTPTSIGRNVAMCHPPKSMKKVMQLIQDLKSKKRESETMWFKKEDEYVHVTYKGVFDENGEYLGILEYVQDIQPFLDLTREVKRELR